MHAGKILVHIKLRLKFNNKKIDMLKAWNPVLHSRTPYNGVEVHVTMATQHSQGHLRTHETLVSKKTIKKKRKGWRRGGRERGGGKGEVGGEGRARHDSPYGNPRTPKTEVGRLTQVSVLPGLHNKYWIARAVYQVSSCKKLRLELERWLRS